MLPVELHEAGNSAFVSALVGAAAAMLVAVIGGIFTYFVTTRRIQADTAIAKRNAQALLSAAERQASAVIKAATEQAAGVREAGLRNAIETEAMRLRFRMAERHLDRFHEHASAVVALLSEIKRSERGAQLLDALLVGVPQSTMREAELVIRLEDWERLLGARTAYLGACASIGAFLQTRGVDPRLWSVDDHTDLMKSLSTATNTLQHIIAITNTSSVMRAQGITDVQQQVVLESLYERWEEQKALLKRMHLWQERLTGED